MELHICSYVFVFVFLIINLCYFNVPTINTCTNVYAKLLIQLSEMADQSAMHQLGPRLPATRFFLKLPDKDSRSFYTYILY